jgi:transcription termination factor Rho
MHKQHGRPAPEGPNHRAEGVLEVCPEVFGFLRRAERDYLPEPGDVFVPQALIRQYAIREGSTIAGIAGSPSGRGRGPALRAVESINDAAPELHRTRAPFHKLVCVDPHERFDLGEGTDDASLRVLDLIAPIGRGQRALIVSPPRAGKTVLLQKIACFIGEHYPDVHLLVVLVDERPEESSKPY